MALLADPVRISCSRSQVYLSGCLVSTAGVWDCKRIAHSVPPNGLHDMTEPPSDHLTPRLNAVNGTISLLLFACRSTAIAPIVRLAELRVTVPGQRTYGMYLTPAFSAAAWKSSGSCGDCQRPPANAICMID